MPLRSSAEGGRDLNRVLGGYLMEDLLNAYVPSRRGLGLPQDLMLIIEHHCVSHSDT